MPRAIVKLAGILIILAAVLAAAPAGAEVLVQVMSVQDEAAAIKEAARLFDLGIPAFSHAEQVPEKGVWNRVYLGPFETESDAATAAETLKKQGTIKDYLVKTGPAPEAAAARTEDGIPVIETALEGPAPAGPKEELPVAEIPTYGEPVSPELAREMGLPEQPRLATYGEDGPAPARPGGLSTYGQAEARPPRSLPEDFKVGDDLPGLVTPDGTAGSGPSPESRPSAAAPADSSAAPVTAPSAGEGDGPWLTAQYSDERGYASSRLPQKLNGFTVLADLSSSMTRMSPCQAKIKEEAVATLLRKMNRRIPDHPYNSSLRVFGYKFAITKRDFTTLYYGPASYDREAFEDAIARLAATASVSPFAAALNAADNELAAMGNPKAVLMFADFEESVGSGQPVQSARNARRRYGRDLAIYTYYVTRQLEAARLAREIAQEGGGSAFDICRLLEDDTAFEAMMMEVFGPGDTVTCADQDGDGVCDEDDRCPDTPRGAPVDERGCWIAAYSQFFDFDKAVVKNAFLPRIKHAAEIMNKNPNLPRVVIAGHTDNVGRAEYNLELGRRRAQAVYDLMVKYGVAPGRMLVESYGADRPVATNETEEGRARNRRVEFHIGDVPPHQQ
ncbi:MAG: OmpA family protein [Candidatus Adiutrix sp.]|nr:OmpA family protein [Candidatus Adiutrix sp.]